MPAREYDRILRYLQREESARVAALQAKLAEKSDELTALKPKPADRHSIGDMLFPFDCTELMS